MDATPRFRTEVFTAVLGAAVLVAAVVALLLTSVPATAGDVPSPAVAGTAVAPWPDLPTAHQPATTAEQPPPSPPPHDTAAEAEISPPAGLSLPALGVDAEVHEVGLQHDGAMEVPDDVHELGWYHPGPAPGEAGNAVIAGHVDGRGQGPGAFWDLGTLDPGGTFTLSHADGEISRWEVVARRSYAKDELPMGELFTRDGPPRLALITCGGAFDPAARSYERNVVVHAEPLTGT